MSLVYVSQFDSSTEDIWMDACRIFAVTQYFIPLYRPSEVNVIHNSTPGIAHSIILWRPKAGEIQGI